MSARKVNQSEWALPLLGKAFDRFFAENGHYPSALEIDSCPYLCTSRLIQLKFGGIQNLRKKLNINFTSYGEGEHRKALWKKAGKLSLEGEHTIGRFLIERYGEICVHEEKRYGEGLNRLDFYIYAKPNFAVEIFNTSTIHGITGNLNAKLKKYIDFPYILFFVVTGGKFSQSQIDRVISQRQADIMKGTMKCMTQECFISYCLQNIQPLSFTIS